jgi:GTP-binding protein
VERCKILVHLIDVSGLGPDNPINAYQAINKELGLYDSRLLEKQQLIVASKMDAVESERLDQIERFCSKQGFRLLKVSAVSGTGLVELKQAMYSTLEGLSSESGNSGRNV